MGVNKLNKKETINFMERVKSHYQEFIIDDFKISEWYGKLKDYDAEDVNKKFDEHLGSEVYGDYIPKIMFLTKYLTPTKEKGKLSIIQSIVQNANVTYLMKSLNIIPKDALKHQQ